MDSKNEFMSNGAVDDITSTNYTTGQYKQSTNYCTNINLSNLMFEK